MLAAPEQRFTDLALERGPLDRVPSVAEGAPVGVDSPAIVRKGLGIGGHAASLVASFEEIVLRLLPHFGLGVVMGKHAVELIETVREELLDALGYALMELASALDQDTRVRRLLDERVGEYVLELWQSLPLADQLHVLQVR